MDFANTASDLEIAASISENDKYVRIKGKSGHCPGLRETFEEVAKLVEANIR